MFDTSDGAPTFIVPDASSPKLTSRLSEFARLGRPAVNRDGKTVITVQKPTSDGERFTFCLGATPIPYPSHHRRTSEGRLDRRNDIRRLHSDGE